MIIKRAPSLTEQVKVHIKQMLLGEGFADGRIPSETDLAEQLGVSRTTVRDALSRLEMEGAVYRRQGSGTFINRPVLQIKSRLEEMWSYEAIMEAHGYTSTTRLLSADLLPAAADTIQELGLADPSQVLVVRKLFLENDQPAILVANTIPLALIPRPYRREDCQQPVYEFLHRVCGQSLSYYLSELVPVVADAALAQALEVGVGTAVLSFAEIGYNDANQPILQATSWFRDDLLRFRVIRRQS